MEVCLSRNNRRRHRRARRLRKPCVFFEDGCWHQLEWTAPGEYWLSAVEPPQRSATPPLPPFFEGCCDRGGICDCGWRPCFLDKHEKA